MTFLARKLLGVKPSSSAQPASPPGEGEGGEGAMSPDEMLRWGGGGRP